MNILVWGLSLFIGIVIGMFWFIFLIIALNGFSESVANYGIYTYLAWSIATSLIVATISAIGVNHIKKTSKKVVLRVILALVFSTVLCVASDFVGLIVSTIVTDQVRQSRIKK